MHVLRVVQKKVLEDASFDYLRLGVRLTAGRVKPKYMAVVLCDARQEEVQGLRNLAENSMILQIWLR